VTLVRDAGITTIAEAFDRFLSEGRPAHVAHRGPSPRAAIAAIAAAGGIASLAHPGTAHLDELIPQLVADGLAAIEVYHSSHDEAATVRYRELAALHEMAVTGGSNFHGPTARRAEFLGRVGLPPRDFARLVHRAGVTNLARA
jgi:predicted metal-dependent phosphoesterase TrpH